MLEFLTRCIHPQKRQLRLEKLIAEPVGVYPRPLINSRQMHSLMFPEIISFNTRQYSSTGPVYPEPDGACFCCVCCRNGQPCCCKDCQCQKPKPKTCSGPHCGCNCEHCNCLRQKNIMRKNSHKRDGSVSEIEEMFGRKLMQMYRTEPERKDDSLSD